MKAKEIKDLLIQKIGAYTDTAERYLDKGKWMNAMIFVNKALTSQEIFLDIFHNNMDNRDTEFIASRHEILTEILDLAKHGLRLT